MDIKSNVEAGEVQWEVGQLNVEIDEHLPVEKGLVRQAARLQVPDRKEAGGDGHDSRNYIHRNIVG